MEYKISDSITLDSNNPLENLLKILQDVCEGACISAIRIKKPMLQTTGEIWFRGEPSDYPTRLLPKIFRDPHNKFEEADLLLRFKNRFPKFNSSCQNILDWLNIMQHYGVPTRLLDWTKSALIALYFATDSKDTDGVLYTCPIINRLGNKNNSLSEPIIATSSCFYKFYEEIITATSVTGLETILKKNIPNIKLETINNKIKGHVINSSNEKPPAANLFPTIIEYFPKLLHDRILTQQGCFTLHFGKYIQGINILDDTLTLDRHGFINLITKIIIPAKTKANLRKQLYLLGITPLNIYPEPENFYKDYEKLKSIEK